MSALLADAARDSLRLYLMTQLPAQITAVNAARPQRSVSDAVSTNGSATITSATAAFVAADAGQPYTLSAAGPAGRAQSGIVLSVVNATTATIWPTPQTSGGGQTLTVGKHPLSPIASWSANPLVATPTPPAIGILPQKGGFRGTQWPVTFDQTHFFHVYVQAANQDEDVLMSDLLGYSAALIGAVALTVRGLAAIPRGYTFLFGEGGPDALDAQIHGPSQQVANQLFYGDCTLPLSLWISEAP